MATNQTPRLGLSDWSAQDMVTMAEFNQDHQRLEDRLGYLAAEPIMEITLEEDAAVVSLDVSSVDWARYDHVYLDTWLTSDSERVSLRANGSTSADQHLNYLNPTNSGTTHITGYLAYLNGAKKSRVCFNVMGDPSWTLSLSFQLPNYTIGWGRYSNMPYTNVQRLNISPVSSSGDVLKAGSRIKVWGVRG